MNHLYSNPFAGEDLTSISTTRIVALKDIESLFSLKVEVLRFETFTNLLMRGYTARKSLTSCADS